MSTHEAERKAFRAWIRVHHPDVGGDPAAFARGLERWRAGAGGLSTGRSMQVNVFRSHHGLWLLARWWKRRRRREQRVL